MIYYPNWWNPHVFPLPGHPASSEISPSHAGARRAGEAETGRGPEGATRWEFSMGKAWISGENHGKNHGKRDGIEINPGKWWIPSHPESSRVVKILESRMERDGKSWGVPLRSMVFFLIGIDVLPWNTCGFKLLMSEWKIIIHKLYEIMVGCSIGAYVWLCYYTFQYYL